MKAVVAKPPRRSHSKVRTARSTNGTNGGKLAPKAWTPPDFKQRLLEDFGGKIKPYRYVDFLER